MQCHPEGVHTDPPVHTSKNEDITSLCFIQSMTMHHERLLFSVPTAGDVEHAQRMQNQEGLSSASG
jgi:hypothetical protein